LGGEKSLGEQKGKVLQEKQKIRRVSQGTEKKNHLAGAEAQSNGSGQRFVFRGQTSYGVGSTKEL